MSTDAERQAQHNQMVLELYDTHRRNSLEMDGRVRRLREELDEMRVQHDRMWLTLIVGRTDEGIGSVMVRIGSLEVRVTSRERRDDIQTWILGAVVVVMLFLILFVVAVAIRGWG